MTAAPSDNWQVDLSEPQGNLYVAEGWSPPDPNSGVRYAVRAQAGLMLPIPDAGGSLALQLAGPMRAVRLQLNGHALQPATQFGNELTLIVPPGLATALVDRLEFTFAGPGTEIRDVAKQYTAGRADLSALGAELAPDVALLVQSAGEEVGSFAHIYVNGVDVALNRRGYNLAALDSVGQVLDSANFDTFADTAQSAALIAWVEQWPAGTLIAGAAADEASFRLQPDAAAALAQIGVRTDLRDYFRWSHAFIGVKGAPPGTAIESADLLAPVSVQVGPAINGPRVFGGVRSIQFRAGP